MAFKAATPNEDERIIASIHGRTKRGKTSLALTFPSPRFLIDLDHGARELFRIEPELLVGTNLPDPEYHIPERITHEEALALLNHFLDDYQDACDEAAKYGGTVIVDTATQLHQFVQKVMLDKVVNKRIKETALKLKVKPEDVDADLTRIFPYDYREANALETAIIQRPYAYPKLNAVFLGRHRELYDGPNPTGKWGFQGFSGMEDLVQLNVELKFRDGDTGPVVATFGPNRFRQDLVGMEWEDRLTYTDLVDMFLKPPKKRAKAA
jgi:hypothetical protein